MLKKCDRTLRNKEWEKGVCCGYCEEGRKPEIFIYDRPENKPTANIAACNNCKERATREATGSRYSYAIFRKRSKTI